MLPLVWNREGQALPRWTGDALHANVQRKEAGDVSLVSGHLLIWFPVLSKKQTVKKHSIFRWDDVINTCFTMIFNF